MILRKNSKNNRLKPKEKTQKKNLSQNLSIESLENAETKMTQKISKLKTKIQNEKDTNNDAKVLVDLGGKKRDAEWQLSSAESNLEKAEKELEVNKKLLEQYEATVSD